MAEPGALSRGHIRAKLVADLALDAVTRAELSRQYGVSRSAITAFAKRHAWDINRARERIEDRFSALWIADKFNRVAELQQVVDDVDELLADPGKAARSGVQWAEMARTKITAIRNVAEELGQLPNRQTIQHEGGVSVRYIFHGVDLDKLS